MIVGSFLDKIANVIVSNHANSLAKTIVVLPNKRARVFLIESLARATTKNIICPEIISIEDFVEKVANIRSLDSIELLFEFYDSYLAITDKSLQQPFESFANWAKVILQDFNAIDRYLLDSAYVLSYLKDIDDIKRWGIEVDQKTQLLESYINFWKLLPKYYDSLYSHLLAKGIGYQGLIYREAVANIDSFCTSIGDSHFVFAGFNALNAAEEHIFQLLVERNKASVYWDIDKVFIDDVQHDAGLFARRFKSKWKYYKSNTFDWIVDEFSASKKIQLIGTPKNVGQAKIVASIIENYLRESDSASLDKVAVVLADENLLVPLLYSLPSTVEALNITMGYPSKTNPAQVLVSKLFKLHLNAFSRNSKDYVFYFKDLLDVLNHPFVVPFTGSSGVVDQIISNNYTFLTHQKLTNLNPSPTDFFSLLFDKWDKGAKHTLKTISDLLIIIKQNLSEDSEEDKLAKAFLHSIFKTINKICNYYSNRSELDSIDVLHAIYKQVIEFAEVSFEGEPLQGLQIMGVLESRALDFDTVIITSLNEGKLPAGKSSNSFIPYDVKRELGLPTFKEKDAIYTYHFYHLLLRAKNVFLIYNTETDGIDAGEMSRFITQLEIEKQPLHNLSHQIYSPILPVTANQSISIAKSSLLINRLKEIADRGFSPSALTSYIRNPLDFYFQKVLRIRDTEEVEEDIALNTLGTIIHETLETLYRPYIGKFLNEDDIVCNLKLVETEILTQFKLIYKEGEIQTGKNLLAFEVAKRNISNFLNMELESIRNGDLIKILHLEKSCSRTLVHPSLSFPIKIAGNVDRIEERHFSTGQKVLRIIDYKTGKVDKANLKLKSWDGLASEIKNDKIIQLLAYAYMFENDNNDLPLEVGIISFKNMKAGFLPFIFKDGKEETSLVDGQILESYVEQIALLLKEIFDDTIPFLEKKL